MAMTETAACPPKCWAPGDWNAFFGFGTVALAGAVLTFFGFMHGEAVGIAVTPSVALAYAMAAAFLFALSRMPAEAAAPVMHHKPRAVPAE